MYNSYEQPFVSKREIENIYVGSGVKLFLKNE